MLSARASPLPAMSNAVPWSTDVRMNGSASVTLTAPWKSRVFAAMCPWS